MSAGETKDDNTAYKTVWVERRDGQGKTYFHLPRYWTHFKKLGEGAFGTVVFAKDSRPLPVVRPGAAIKQVKLQGLVDGDDSTLADLLRELQIMRHLKTHAPDHFNLVQMVYPFLPPPERKVDSVYLLMHYRGHPIYPALRVSVPSVSDVASIMFQLLSGLQALHALGIVHRDVSYHNVLVFKQSAPSPAHLSTGQISIPSAATSADTSPLTPVPSACAPPLPATSARSTTTCSSVSERPPLYHGYHVSIGDFGQSCVDRTRLVETKTDTKTHNDVAPRMSGYKTTRWVRAPELCVSASEHRYDCSIDLWAAGCLFYALLTGVPPFQGTSKCQLLTILEGLGVKDVWSGERRTALTTEDAVEFEDVIALVDRPTARARLEADIRKHRSSVPDSAINLLCALLEVDPNARITADAALASPFFDDVRHATFCPPRIVAPASLAKLASLPVDSSVVIRNAPKDPCCRNAYWLKKFRAEVAQYPRDDVEPPAPVSPIYPDAPHIDHVCQVHEEEQRARAHAEVDVVEAVDSKQPPCDPSSKSGAKRPRETGSHATGGSPPKRPCGGEPTTATAAPGAVVPTPSPAVTAASPASAAVAALSHPVL